MKKRVIKKSAYPILYGMLVCAIMGGLFVIDSINNKLKPVSTDFEYVGKMIFDNIVPVIDQKEALIVRPYTNEDMQIMTNFYDENSADEVQQKSLIYFEGTYMPSTGISYSCQKEFDVVAILEGTVMEVKEDELLGTVVKIKHGSDLISVYESVSQVTVKANDTVSQGQTIAKSGLSNIEPNLDSHLHFELIRSGVNVNPEEYYDKNINEL